MQKAKIEEISKQIDAGDYRVSLPGLGDVSRNQLKSRIASLQERITALQRNFKSGDVRINRFSKGWLTANGLKESEQLLKDKSAELKENIKKKEYKHLLPIGWVTPKDLDARISQLQEEIENIKTQLANKQYKIALADGSWATEKDIDKALMNSLLSVDVKAALARGKKSILVVSQYEIAKRELELAKLKNWKAELKSHILPLSDFYSQQLKQYAALKKEFSVEQTAAIAPLKLRLSFMQRSLRQLP